MRVVLLVIALALPAPALAQDTPPELYESAPREQVAGADPSDGGRSELLLGLALVAVAGAAAAREVGPAAAAGVRVRSGTARAEKLRARRPLPARLLRHIRGTSVHPLGSRARGTPRSSVRPEALAAAPHQAHRPLLDGL